MLTLVNLFPPKHESCPGQPSSPSPIPPITCMEALTVGDDAINTPELLVLDTFAHKAYPWVGGSSHCR